jgi:hypothetical protein
MKKAVYFEGLGYRNPVSDKDQIIWFFEQTAATKHKNHVTRYWLDLKEWYMKCLLEREAYELLAFIMDKLTTAQEKRRQESRKKSKAKAEKEMEAFNNWYAEYNAKRNLINQIGSN